MRMMGSQSAWVRSIYMLAAACLLLATQGCFLRQRPYVPEAICPSGIDPCNVDLCPGPPCSWEYRRALICYFNMHEVIVSRAGEEMRIIIPSNLMYKPFSANFYTDYFPVIEALPKFLKCFKKVDVKIAGYTDCCGCEGRNKMITQLQAERLAKYLWSEGIDSRLLHSVGYGSQHPIARQHSFHGRARNRRIEITFRYIPRHQGYHGLHHERVSDNL